MKKLLSFALSVLLIAGCCTTLFTQSVAAVPAPIDSNIVVSADSVTATGTTATVCVRFSGVEQTDQLGSFRVKFGFDATKLSVKTYIKGPVINAMTAVDGYQLLSPKVNNPLVALAYTMDLDADRTAYNDVIVTVVFNVLSGWTGDTPITISLLELSRLSGHYDEEGNPVEDEYSGAKINPKAVGGIVNGNVHVDHANYEWKLVAGKPSTCTTHGKEILTCSDCGETYGDERDVALDPTNHKDASGNAYGTHEETIAEATCHSDRTYKTLCDGCNAVILDNQTEENSATGSHVWSTWEVTTAATCTAKGEKTRHCTNDGCTETETEEIAIDSTNHGTYQLTWVDDLPAATCTTQGLKHQECSGCHAIVAGTENTPSAMNPANHTGSGTHEVTIAAATCHSDRTYKMVCDGCGATILDNQTQANSATGSHVWSTWEVTTAATCTAKGERTRHCTNDGCTETQTEEIAIDPNNHGTYQLTWVDDLPAATCTTTGLKHQECAGCHGIVAGTENTPSALNPANHTGSGTHEVTIAAATCHSDRTYKMVCNGCDATILDNQTQPNTATGAHVWSAWDVTTAATCTAKGEKTRHCTNDGCTETQTEEIAIDPTNHGTHEATWRTDTPATCTTAGTRHQECSGCLATIAGTQNTPIPIDPSAHVQDSGIPYGTHQVTIAEATCYSDRTYKTLCDGCNALILDNQTQENTATGNHVFGAWEVTTAATCTAKGEKTRHCTTTGCTETETDEVAIDPTNHGTNPTRQETITEATLEADRTYRVICMGCNTILQDNLTDEGSRLKTQVVNETDRIVLQGGSYPGRATLNIDDNTENLTEEELQEIAGQAGAGKTVNRQFRISLLDERGNPIPAGSDAKLRIQLTEDMKNLTNLTVASRDADGNITILTHTVEDDQLVFNAGSLGEILLLSQAPVTPSTPPRTSDNASIILIATFSVSLISLGLFAITKKKESVR